MSSPSNPTMEKDENATQPASNMPQWLDQFVENKFFNECSTHHLQRNPELNRYCITCNASACRHCIANGCHDEHKVLTIYRHVYQAVVPLNQMENHMDCSKIQTYKCNKKWVVSLKPLPHTGSGSRIEGDGACKVCKRKLTANDGRFSFCSIICKFQAIGNMGMMELRPTGASTSQSGRKRSRKGVPQRTMRPYSPY